MKVLTRDEFLRSFEETCGTVRQNFERAGAFPHTVMLFGPRGPFLFPFDELANRMTEAAPEFLHKQDVHSLAKDAVYKAAAVLAEKMDAYAYVEVAEAWMLKAPPGASKEEVLRSHDELRKRYGPSLENVPGRMEVLAVFGQYGRETVRRTWKVVRGPSSAPVLRLETDEALKEELRDGEFERRSRSAVLERAVVDGWLKVSREA